MVAKRNSRVNSQIFNEQSTSHNLAEQLQIMKNNALPTEDNQNTTGRNKSGHESPKKLKLTLRDNKYL